MWPLPDLPLDPPEPRDCEREEYIRLDSSDMDYDDARDEKLLNGRIVEARYTYKCGHVWTTQYSRGASSREVKVSRQIAENLMCPKCNKSEKVEGFCENT